MSAFSRSARAAQGRTGVFACLGASALLVGLLCWLPARAWVAQPDDKKAVKDEPVKAAAAKVDVVFVVDATASMDAHLKNLRESMGKLAEQLEAAKVDARYAATIFRDRVDNVGNTPEDPFALKIAGDEIFSKDIADVARKLADVKAEGGGDLPESCFDGIDFASRVAFRKDAKKVLVVITDAPPRIPDKDMKDADQLAKLLKERAIDQLHVFHDLEPEHYKKLQSQLGKAGGRLVSLFPGGVDRMKSAMADIGRDAVGAEAVAVGPGPATGGKGKVDVVFVVDTTGSMGGDLTALRDTMKRFVTTLKDSKADFQIGVTTFKDRVEDPPETRDPKALLFGGKEFTNDGDALIDQVGKLNADGGGDEPESGLDALEFASRRPFRPGARKVLVLLTDAPPRIPDKDMKDEDQVHKILRERDVEQLHLIVRGGVDRYIRLNGLIGKGRVVNIGKGEDFGGGMEAIARESAAGLKEGDAIATKKVDLVIVLDATGSMDAHIAGVRDNVKRILKRLGDRKLDVRVGVTVFRDAVDMMANTPEDPFALKFGADEFTTDAEMLEKEIGKVAAKDGGDIPESGFDGLEFASRRAFRPDAARVLLVVTDAPPRTPDKKMRNEVDTSEALRKAGIHQLHLIVKENPKLYEEVQRLIKKDRSPGVVLNLETGGGFAKMFDDVSDGIIVRLGPVEPPPVVVGGPPKLDVVFVVDTTGSMSGDLNSLRDTIGRFHKLLADSKVDFRIGVTQFKDRVEDPPETREPKATLFDGNEFTTKLDALTREIGAFKAEGGGDDPESGLDAIEFATRRPFRKDARKVLILLTDAPPRIPDKDMKDEDQVAKILKERGIDQIHLLGRNAVDRYERLVKLHTGTVVRIDRDDFGGGMEKLAKESISGPFVAHVNKLDLVVVLDTTGSMDAHMKNLRDHLPALAKVLKDSKADFRLGVVVFKDRVEDPPPDNESKMLVIDGKEFTTDADAIVRELAKINAAGGGDAPESGLDALEFTSRRAFRPDARKVLIFVTDDGPRIPDKDMKDEDQCGKLLKERGIETVHMFLGASKERYEKLAKMMPRPGKTVDINRGADDFKKSLEEMAVAAVEGGGVFVGERKVPIAGSKADLVFVIDTTGSMSDFTGALLKPAERMVKKLQDSKVDVRFSLITFRDRHPGDGNVPEDHKLILLGGKEFSTDFEEFRKEVGLLKADSGGDAPESSLDALAFAAKRDFRPDALKTIILVTDEGPKVPDKDMRDENDVLRIYRERGIHQLHLIVAANTERYLNLQRMMGRAGVPAGKKANLNDRNNEPFNREIDDFSVAILDGLRMDVRVKLSERPLPPLKLERTADGKGMIDVVFVLDATASMDTEIRWVKEGGPKMMKRLKDLGVDGRFGVTIFRDRVDKMGNTPEDPFSLMFKGEEFTSDPDAFAAEVGMVKAKEGGDIPESSLDGMEFASRRPFRKGAYKVLILVTDAPPRIPDKDMKDEFQLGELLRERGINQLHLLLKTEPDRYSTLQRFLTGDGSAAGVHYDLAPLDRGERTLDRLMDALSRSSVGAVRRGLAAAGKEAPK
ncbi:MAG: vWA domain-containing protein [Gemmataceae bacterium]